MALTLSQTGIEQDQIINSWHVTQSIDAFTGQAAYDITLSGSLILTGSVESLDGYTGSLYGTASHAISASYSEQTDQTVKVRINNLPTNDIKYRLTFVSPTNVPESGQADYTQLVVDSGSDGTGVYYNPADNRLFVGSISSSDSTADVRLYGTASHALNAGTFTDYSTGSYNWTTIYPQGTIYSKFEDVFMSQSAVEEYDLLSATTTFTGDRSIPVEYLNQDTTGEAKVIKFYIKGFIGDTGGLGTPSLETYVKIGSTTLTNGTKLGQLNVNTADEVPFEIEYELVFTNGTVRACGGIGYCQGLDYYKVALSNMYTPDAIPVTPGNLQFIVSGSSAMVMTASLAHIEFIN